MTRIATLLAVAVAIAIVPAVAQAKDVQYECTAKKKSGVADAASVITARSESAGIEAMKKRWPGFASYACVQSK